MEGEGGGGGAELEDGWEDAENQSIDVDVEHASAPFLHLDADEANQSALQ